MRIIAEKMWGVLLLSLALGVSVLTPSEMAFAQEAKEPCPCIAEQYKSEKAYPLYKQAALDWRARKWEDAMVKYHRVIQKHPSSPLAAVSHMGIGLYLKYHKLYDEAIPEFQKGISMIPDTRYARDAKTSIACIYTSQGKYDGALNILRRVLAQAKDWDEVKYCSYWMKEIMRLKANSDSSLRACGSKALATVFRIKRIEALRKELSALVPAKDNRTSMQDLKKAAEAKGLTATGIRLSLAQVKAVEMPVIALLEPGHYIVVSSSDGSGFTVIDPTRGERAFAISGAALQKRWTGYVLLFADKVQTGSRYALLTEDKMKNIFGGVCGCCPTSGNGPPGENPGAEYEDPPSIFVNMVSLNMVVQDTDLSYSGLGPDVEIKRTYNGDDPRETAFGRSWIHSYNIYLTEEPSGDVLVNRGGGKIDRYYYVGSPSSDMTGIWDVTLVCTDTNCPDFRSDVGDIHTSALKITQSANGLTGHLYDPCCPMSGTVDGNSFNLSGYWTETDEGCIIRNDLLIEGTVDANSSSATSTVTLTPLEPVDPNCAGMIGSGCEEVFSSTGVRKVSNTGYITYEPGIYDTLAKSGDGSWSLKIKKDKTSQHFDPNGRLTSIIDRNANALTFSYDVNDNLTSITDAAGRVTTFSYDANDHIVAITDPIGRSASYIYDTNDNLFSSTDMADYTTTYTYDEYSYMTAITTPTGTTTIDYELDEEYGYALQSITDTYGNGRWYATYWTSGEEDVTVTDAHGNTTYYDNLDYGVTGAITDPLGNTTSFGYDIFGNRISVTNANGNTTNVSYDERGNITSITNPLGDVTTFIYDVKDNLTQLKDALSRIYSYTYDPNDNLTKVTDPLANETNFTYDPHGQLTGITDAQSNTTTFVYDSYGNLVSSTDPFSGGEPGSLVGWGRDNYGQSSVPSGDDFTSISGGGWHSLALKSDGSLVAWGYTYFGETDVPDGNDYIAIAAGPHHNLALKFDGSVAAWGKNNYGQCNVSEPNSGFVAIAAGGEHSLGLKEDGSVAAWGRNNYGQCNVPAPNSSFIAIAAGGEHSLGLKENGSVAAWGKNVEGQCNVPAPNSGFSAIAAAGGWHSLGLKEDGSVVGWGWNGYGQCNVPTPNSGFVAIAGGGEHSLGLKEDGSVAAWGYNSNGQCNVPAPNSGFVAIAAGGYHSLAIISSGDNYTTTYAYDGAGRLLSRTDAKGNTVSYAYDGLDRVTEVNYPDGNIIYAYDSSNLISITDKDSQVTTFEYDNLNRLTRVVYPGGYASHYSYDALGNRTSITYPDGRVVYYWYDWANRLTRVRDWMMNNTVYTYDAAGNLICTKNLPYRIVTTYSYNNAGRLVSLETKRSDDSIICSYQYTLDAVGNRIAIEANTSLDPNVAFGDVQCTYNQDNQLLTANGTTFQYDENGNLIEKTEGGNTTTYTYDYDNRLTQVSTGGSIYQYKYDTLGNRIAKTENGVITKYFVDINRLLPQVLAEADEYGNIQNAYVYGLGLISKVDQEWDAYYYHYDGIGSTVAITDQSSNIVNKYAYTPFGVLAAIEESIPNPFRYVGRFGVMDDGNGLLYMRARYYAPEIGRFMRKDPAGFVRTVNLYEYAAGNPVRFIDPFGLRDQQEEDWQWFSDYGFRYRARKIKDWEDLTLSEKIRLIIKTLGDAYNSVPNPWPGPFPTPSDPRYEIDEESITPDFGPGGAHSGLT